jgi:hypothetical protein
MRWDELFADLEAQLEREEAAEHRAEIADRTRRELAWITLLDRLVAHRGSMLSLGICGSGSGQPGQPGEPADQVQGVLVDVAAQWVLVEERPARATLVPVAAVSWVRGLGRASVVPPQSSLARRVGLSAALRSLAQHRVAVSVRLRDGSTVTGTFDRVGADQADLAEHLADEPRRSGAVRGVRTLPFGAIGFVRPA